MWTEKHSRCVERLGSSRAQQKVNDYDLLSSLMPQL